MLEVNGGVIDHVVVAPIGSGGQPSVWNLISHPFSGGNWHGFMFPKRD